MPSWCWGAGTSIGFDSFDLFLDLVVDRDSLACRWKDEDEYEHARRLGVVSDAVHAEVDEARQAVVELARARSGPFAHNSTDWRPDPGWARPVLPPQALTVPVRY